MPNHRVPPEERTRPVSFSASMLTETLMRETAKELNMSFSKFVVKLYDDYLRKNAPNMIVRGCNDMQ